MTGWNRRESDGIGFNRDKTIIWIQHWLSLIVFRGAASVLTLYCHCERICNHMGIRVTCCICYSSGTKRESVPRVVTWCQGGQTCIITCRRWCPSNNACCYAIVRWLGYIYRHAWNDWIIIIWKLKKKVEQTKLFLYTVLQKTNKLWRRSQLYFSPIVVTRLSSSKNSCLSQKRPDDVRFQTVTENNNQ